jgi:hypothetical protein
MSVRCPQCRRFLAERVDWINAMEFRRLHRSQTGHIAVIEEAK